VSENWKFWLTIAWFLLTYTGLALGKLPRLRIDRPGIALVGAALVLATGLLSFEDAVRSIDFATIALLLGMMILVSYLWRAGFFERLASIALGRIGGPRGLLAVTMALSGVLSAVLVNDVVCLALTPLVLHLTRRLRLDPKPHLLGLALAANIGSTATPTGNPQNMIIGGLSHISFLRFAVRLAPIAAVSLVVAFLLVAWICRAALRPSKESPVDAKNESGTKPLRWAHTKLLIKGVFVTLATVILFFAGAPMEIVALGAAAVMLLDGVNPERIYRRVDWSLLLMFAGLFVVVHAFEVHVMSRWPIADWQPLKEHSVSLLSLLSAVLSNLVSNVPAVLLFKSVIPALPDNAQETAWLALAMSSTLAGNFTVLGSVANLIVVESARREGVLVSFWEYLRVGVPVTLLTLLIGVLWLCCVNY
jgi:Na+/H+ antiporter NhaD/arsenite permease-like protein